MFFTLKLKTFIRRFASKTFGLSRPASFPFITGDSFRALAQHVYDESSDFNPEDVRHGDIIFIRTGWVNDFFSKIEPHIKNPYVLISHNEDLSINDEHVSLLEKSGKILHWFAQNLTISHKNFSPIPIGLQNLYYKNGNILANLRTIQKENNSKTITATCLFSIIGNGNAAERQSIVDISKKLSWVETKEVRGIEYARTLSISKFILSPAGSGEDCHRTWEALYLGSIPVVKKTPMTTFYSGIGIPLYIVDSWDELENITEQQLEAFYTEYSAKLQAAAIYMPYWVDTICSKTELQINK